MSTAASLPVRNELMESPESPNHHDSCKVGRCGSRIQGPVQWALPQEVSLYCPGKESTANAGNKPQAPQREQLKCLFSNITPCSFIQPNPSFLKCKLQTKNSPALFLYQVKSNAEPARQEEEKLSQGLNDLRLVSISEARIRLVLTYDSSSSIVSKQFRAQS